MKRHYSPFHLIQERVLVIAGLYKMTDHNQHDQKHLIIVKKIFSLFILHSAFLSDIKSCRTKPPAGIHPSSSILWVQFIMISFADEKIKLENQKKSDKIINKYSYTPRILKEFEYYSF